MIVDLKEERMDLKKKDDVECSLALCAIEKTKSMEYGQWMLKIRDR